MVRFLEGLTGGGILQFEGCAFEDRLGLLRLVDEQKESDPFNVGDKFLGMVGRDFFVFAASFFQSSFFPVMTRERVEWGWDVAVIFGPEQLDDGFGQENGERFGNHDGAADNEGETAERGKEGHRNSCGSGSGAMHDESESQSDQDDAGDDSSPPGKGVFGEHDKGV